MSIENKMAAITSLCYVLLRFIEAFVDDKWIKEFIFTLRIYCSGAMLATGIIGIFG